ncbi:MAG TPA: 4'-phosphopantetheinyl transferase superfamily protein, partial [Gammaproteobacteria bacterium]|nr:4'-phosphopantetheinyl transferase superfamily protein [Gammaproteobacteria bacterium]
MNNTTDPTVARVWFAEPDTLRAPHWVQRFDAVLDRGERRRMRRFLRPEDAHHFRVAHALLRHALSRECNRPPQDWCFCRGPRGRPGLAETDCTGDQGLCFNLTHTPGLVACVVTRGGECGIDAEALRPRVNPLGIARRMFAPDEAKELESLEGEALLRAFYRGWTLREAYVKARGTGLAFPTRRLGFEFRDDRL